MTLRRAARPQRRDDSAPRVSVGRRPRGRAPRAGGSGCAVLAQVEASTRAALQRLAGEVARPARSSEEWLRKALLRKEREDRKLRDQALRRTRASGASARRPSSRRPRRRSPAGRRCLRLRSTAPWPAGQTAGAGRARPRGRAQVLRLQGPYRRVTGSTTSSARSVATRNQTRRRPTADLRGRVALVHGRAREDRHQRGAAAAARRVQRRGCTRFPARRRGAATPGSGLPRWKDRALDPRDRPPSPPSVEFSATGSTRRCRASTSRFHNACRGRATEASAPVYGPFASFSHGLVGGYIPSSRGGRGPGLTVKALLAGAAGDRCASRRPHRSRSTGLAQVQRWGIDEAIPRHAVVHFTEHVPLKGAVEGVAPRIR